MPRTLNKLTARAVINATKPGRYGDGGGLSLVVDADGRRRWVLRYQIAGKTRDMGLGSGRDMPLAEARERAEAARKLIRDGRDPISARDADKRASAPVPSFKQVADDLLGTISTGFKNEKHRRQWRSTLDTHAAGLMSKSVDAITTTDVLSALKPIWNEIPETASRVRQRIERVLSAATVKGLRTGENPARWRGHLDHLLPPPRKLARGHHRALPLDDMPAFVEKLRERCGVAPLGVEFVIQTAARSGEVRGARWSEIDLEANLWTIPAERMKARRPHRVPLTERALAILREAAEFRALDDDPLIFPGTKRGSALSDMSLTAVLRRMEIDATVHGFRSVFRDFAGDRTNFPREVAEAALAHAVGDATEQAYRRGDALEKRRKLMEAWSSFIEPKPANVVTLPVRRA